MDMPLALTTLLFALFALAEWRRHAVLARVYLGVATAFAIGAVSYPGMSITDVLDGSHDGLVYLLAAARVTAFTAVLVSVTAFLRERALG